LLLAVLGKDGLLATLTPTNVHQAVHKAAKEAFSKESAAAAQAAAVRAAAAAKSSVGAAPSAVEAQAKDSDSDEIKKEATIVRLQQSYQMKQWPKNFAAGRLRNESEQPDGLLRCEAMWRQAEALDLAKRDQKYAVAGARAAGDKGGLLDVLVGMLNVVIACKGKVSPGPGLGAAAAPRGRGRGSAC